MAFQFATVPPQPTLLEAKGGEEELDKSNSVVDTVPEDDIPCTGWEVILGHGINDGIALVELHSSLGFE